MAGYTYKPPSKPTVADVPKPKQPQTANVVNIKTQKGKRNG